jgi:Spy/CpxP family protein refolding chaperone
MTKRVLIAAGLVAALAGGGTVAMAQTPPDAPGVQRRGPGPRVGARMLGGRPADFGLRGIQLSDAQREQFRTIIESHRAERQAVATKLRQAHRGLAEATRAETINEATIRARSAEVASAMADEAILRAKVRSEVFGILTAEQQQRARELRSATPRGNRPGKPRRPAGQ